MNKFIISKRSFISLLLAMLGILIFFSTIGMILLYKNVQIPIHIHYAAIVTTINKLRESLIEKSIMVSLISFFFAVIGTTVLGIIYSHRIAGPLQQVKIFAALMSQGKFNEKIHFRKEDLIQKLAFALNNMSEDCAKRATLFSNNLKSLEDGLSLLNSLQDGSKEKSELIKKLMEVNAKIIEDTQKLII